MLLVGALVFLAHLAAQDLRRTGANAYFASLNAEKAASEHLSIERDNEGGSPPMAGSEEPKRECLGPGEECSMTHEESGCCASERCMPVGAYASIEGRFPYLKVMCVAVHPPAPKVFSAPACQGLGQYCGEGYPCCAGAQCDPAAHACLSASSNRWWPS